MLTGQHKLRASQRGLSLVEMMVGITVGLLVVAAATLMVTTQLGDNRRLLLETQMQQDLRATADIITRDLRRGGATRRPEVRVWREGEPEILQGNFLFISPTSGSTSSVAFNYQRGEAIGPYGFDLLNGVVRTRLAGGGWQELTDRNVMTVDEFTVTVIPSTTIRLPCPNACSLPPPVGLPADYCWPELIVRNVTVRISGFAVSDPSVRRTIESETRLRNDFVRFNQPNSDPLLAGNPDANMACPQ